MEMRDFYSFLLDLSHFQRKQNVIDFSSSTVKSK